jgi:hypothetical protein
VGGTDTSVNGRSEERRNDRKDTEMRKLIATEWMSVDGVVQAPSYPDEDRSGGSTAAAGTRATSMISP